MPPACPGRTEEWVSLFCACTRNRNSRARAALARELRSIGAGRALLEASLWAQKSDSVLHISDHRRATCICDTITMEGCDAREENRDSLPHSYAKRARREVRRGLRWHAYGNRGR